MAESAGTRLKWGILGCARITRRGLIPGIQASRRGDLAVLASRDGAKAREWANEFGIARSHDSYEALLADADIDAVYIPLPNELHRPWVIAAADAGKHVLCEKPLALDGAEAEEMAAHCCARGVLLMEAAMWRHQPRSRALLERLLGGEIGTLRLVRTSFSFSIEAGDWRLDPRRGGGALMDVGCYGVSAARFFTGKEPRTAQALARMGPSGVDMTLTAELAFDDGVIGLIDCSFEAPFRCICELVGTEGSIEIPDAFLPGETPNARVARTGSDAGAGESRTLAFDGTDQYASMVDAFASARAAGRLLPPAEDGVAQMRALDEIRRVVRTI
jgi:predicted dehydrogenase